MATAHTPLAVLDLVPVTTGSNAGQALRNSLDLVRRAEQLGYSRYWFAEHHFNPGVAGTSPAVLLALAATATSAIRLGSGALQLGHRTALSAVEEFGLLDAVHPGRFDLGLGRSGGSAERGAPPERGGPGTVAVVEGLTPNGLRIPARYSNAHLQSSPRAALYQGLLQQSGAQSQAYDDQVADILALLAGDYAPDAGFETHVVPGEGAELQLWILGSSAGVSARTAGANGLRFAANYHVSPGTVLEAVEGYREAFKPSAELDRPYVSVSADVVVADDEGAARELAAGYGLWVRSIRSGEGAIAYPSPQEARRHIWSEEDRALVADRTETQFVGTAPQVAERLRTLRDATGADELIVTTITHDHADRVRSFELLAAEWGLRAAA
ncbi:LLM class flavin-dependent oxidoreductase [Streptomyces sp. cmx-18-6]|uniref:LLM class flavin-dependent oxidoreductase n=1 Tax=Streptomyces sp. cmx-18-6 TaxID=2790930 RepID=UPI00397EEF8F